MASKVLIPLAEGFEEIEAITLIDLLRRADIDVTTAGVTGAGAIRGAHGVPVVADTRIENVQTIDFDAVILPGGLPGATNLAESSTLGEILQRHYEDEKWVAAICAAPTVLSKYGFLKNREATAYPGFDEKLDCARIGKGEVVEDGTVITSQGPGTAIPFALTMIAKLKGDEKAGEIAKAILVK